MNIMVLCMLWAQLENRDIGQEGARHESEAYETNTDGISRRLVTSW